MANIEDTKTIDGKSMFINEIAPDLMGREVEEVKVDENPLSTDETNTEDPSTAPVVNDPEVIEEDDDSSILDSLLKGDDPEGEIEGTQEDDQSITKGDDTIHEIKVGDDIIKMTTGELKRLAGQETSLNEEKKSVKAKQKELDEQANTLTYLQYQGEFTPKFVRLQNTAGRINDAKNALARGEAYEGKAGDSLGAAITSAEVIFKQEAEKTQADYTKHMAKVKQPGYEALEARVPDVRENFDKYSEQWSNVGREFGFTNVELEQRRDPRFDNMSQEIIELRNFKEDIEGKIKKAKGKRKNKQVADASSKTNATGGSKQKESTSVDYNQLKDGISAGNHDDRITAMRDIKGW